MELREQLPIHAVPEAARATATQQTIEIAGLVEAPCSLARADIAALPHVELVEAFRCEEGWSVPNLAWRGVPLAALLALARPMPASGFVRVLSDGYAVPLRLADCDAAILADELNGSALSVEHGAPWRLVVPGGACFTSVKWVQRLELVAEAGAESGKEIARARLADA